MATILLVIHLMIAVALVATILLQRSEGGALGIGGGGGGMVSNRGAGNLLTRTSAILAGLFFLTSIGLTLLAKEDSRSSSILDTVPEETAAPVVPGEEDVPVQPVPEPLGSRDEPASQGPMVPRAE
ncbi:MAG: preprotein translocase subunit SecG [Parvibaculaceae bacterium]